MKNIGCFNEILQVIEDYGLTHVLGYQHPWNKEIILQFYVTLYISGDESCSTKLVMEWMIEGKRTKCSVMDFVSHFISLGSNMARQKFEFITLMQSLMKISDAQ